MRRWIVLACLAASVFWALGRVLGERGLLASLLFYLPAAPIAGGLLLSAFLLRRSRRLALGVLALALLPLGVTAFEQRWSAPPPPAGGGGSLTLLHWNVCRGYAGWPRIAKRIAAEDPELAILSEVIRLGDAAELARLLPQYPYRRFASPMLVLSRHPLGPIAERNRERGLRLYELEMTQDADSWRFFVLDMVADPEAPRQPGLEILSRQIAARRPDFLAGDFNTPRRSRWLSPIAPGYGHAYELAGSGWSYTWPMPLPVMSLDHLFVNEASVTAESYEIGTSPWSDHRLQRALLRRKRAG